MKFSDNLALAAGSLRNNMLRTAITVSIIAFGIMALIGIITAIGSMTQKMSESFSAMGANGFTIRSRERNIQFGTVRKKRSLQRNPRAEKTTNKNKAISEEDAEQFKQQFLFPATVSLYFLGGSRNRVSFYQKKTTPNVTLVGGDENFIDLNGFTFAQGRNLTPQEVVSSSSVCVLGADIAKKLSPQKPGLLLNRVVRINDFSCVVVGILAARGSTLGFSRDNLTIIPYKQLRRYFPANSFNLSVRIDDVHQVQNAMGEAEGVFRGIRKLNPTEENDFNIDASNSIAEKAIRSISLLTTSVTIIGLITLIGAAIGLMNIMLVAVAERTKEIGVVKAIGGTGRMIYQQFLLEAVLICIIGALLGIALGVLVGNLLSIVLDTSFFIPWMWVLYGIIICSIVGLLAGLYPAIQAAKLNPIEALRYE